MTDETPKRKRWRWIIASVLLFVVVGLTLLSPLRSRFKDTERWRARLMARGVLAYDPDDDRAVSRLVMRLLDSAPPTRVTVSESVDVDILLSEPAPMDGLVQILVFSFLSDRDFDRLKAGFPRAICVDRRFKQSSKGE